MVAAGGKVGIYDVMETGEGDLQFPVPWATEASGSSVSTPSVYQSALKSAGFKIVAQRNRLDFALQFFDELRAKVASAGGPPSFNCEATRRGHEVVSVDPLYRFSADQIRHRIDETVTIIEAQTGKNAADFVWQYFSSVEQLVAARVRTMHRFLDDFPDGMVTGRYIDASLPVLPFVDDQYDIAMCSHFLFLYGKQNGLDFHLKSIEEMCRVAREVWVFPLLELGSVISRHLEGVRKFFQNRDYDVDLVNVPYEFQRGGKPDVTGIKEIIAIISMAAWMYFSSKLDHRVQVCS